MTSGAQACGIGLTLPPPRCAFTLQPTRTDGPVWHRHDARGAVSRTSERISHAKQMLSTATTNPSSTATPTTWPLRMQETWTPTDALAPNKVKHASIREVSGVARKKAIDTIATEYAIALAEARQEEDPESDADIARSVTAYVTYDDVEYCFNTDGLLLDARYDKEGRLDRVAVHRESRIGDWLLLDVVQVGTLATAAEPAAKKRKIVTIDIGKGGRAMYEVFT